MKLSPQDTALFFELMGSLQSYVNQKLGILPDVPTAHEYVTLPPSQRLLVRDVVYENIGLVDAYVQENPDRHSKEELEIVKSWKQFILGEFFIERLLKKYAIFIRGESVYAVLALFDTFEDILQFTRLPYYTKAVLLPFKGKIIYDGFLEGYNVSFGPGMRSNLKETYLAAKQNHRIIESFDPQKKAEPQSQGKPAKDFGPTIEEIANQARKLRSSRGAPAIHSPAFSLAKASIEFTKLAIENPQDTGELWKALKQVGRAMRKAETILHRAEYFD